MDGFAVLKNSFQEYAWGSRTFIQKLLGEPTLNGRPLAELWMGTHPQGPSQVLWKGRWVLLSRLIEEAPESVLGERTAQRFCNQLPFLFKVLAAAQPLSIQCHPNLKQATAGFRREERAGMAPSAPARTYRDQNHKPEIFCALKPSWVLKGFRSRAEIGSLVEKLGLFSPMDGISPGLRKALRKGLRAFFTALITLDLPRQRELVAEALRGAGAAVHREPAFSWTMKLARLFPDDVMVLSPLLFNLIHLKPGDAVMINPGTLHAYLGGAGVELMANSDNVVRAGLTPKVKDIAELMRIGNFHPEPAEILEAKRRDRAEWLYPSKAKEFALSLISTSRDAPHQSSRNRGSEIMICIAGRGRITDMRHGNTLILTRGVSLLVPAAAAQYRIEGRATVYKAAAALK